MPFTDTSALQSTGLRNWPPAARPQPLSLQLRSTRRRSRRPRIRRFTNNRNKERISKRILQGAHRGALLSYCRWEYGSVETVNLHRTGSRAALSEVLLDLRTSSVRRQSSRDPMEVLVL